MAARPVLAALGDRSAGVALIVAIAAPVLLLILGITIDFGYASYVNQRLARATDSAVLASVSQTAASTAGGYGDTDALQNYGQAIFSENVRALNLPNVTFNLSVTPTSDGGASANASYTYDVPTFFSQILGRAAIPVAGQAASSARPITYVNYYILVDASQSMGIGATQADMQALFDRVAANNNQSGGEPGCVFGCHVPAPSNWGGLQPYSNEDLAHNMSKQFGAPITLRIDAAKQAIKGIINDAANTTGTLGNVKFALYTIQADPNSGSLFKQIASLSSDYATLLTQADSIDLGDNTQAGNGDSDFTNELNAFNNDPSILASVNGSGASSTSALNFVIIVTDGVSDVVNGCASCHSVYVFDKSRCDAMKSKATVGVIYTTYLDIWNNNQPNTSLEGNYANLVYPFKSSIAPTLQDCASTPDYFYEASDGPALNSSMSALFAKTLPLTARLTQ